MKMSYSKPGTIEGIAQRYSIKLFNKLTDVNMFNTFNITTCIFIQRYHKFQIVIIYKFKIPELSFEGSFIRYQVSYLYVDLTNLGLDSIQINRPYPI